MKTEKDPIKQLSPDTDLYLHVLIQREALRRKLEVKQGQKYTRIVAKVDNSINRLKSKLLKSDKQIGEAIYHIDDYNASEARLDKLLAQKPDNKDPQLIQMRKEFADKYSERLDDEKLREGVKKIEKVKDEIEKKKPWTPPKLVKVFDKNDMSKEIAHKGMIEEGTALKEPEPLDAGLKKTEPIKIEKKVVEPEITESNISEAKVEQAKIAEGNSRYSLQERLFFSLINGANFNDYRSTENLARELFPDYQIGWSKRKLFDMVSKLREKMKDDPWEIIYVRHTRDKHGGFYRQKKNAEIDQETHDNKAKFDIASIEKACFDLARSLELLLPQGAKPDEEFYRKIAQDLNKRGIRIMPRNVEQYINSASKKVEIDKEPKLKRLVDN